MAAALVLGCTGMVGSHILGTITTASPSVFQTVQTISRRPPKSASSTTVSPTSIVESDPSKWPSELSSLSPTPSILFSALATTRGAAGGFDQQYKLEHDLNVELAKEAKAKGTKIYVLISSANADSNAFFSYTKMKGEIEEHIKELGFDHTVIVRPGLIAGRREESRPLEAVIRKIADFAGNASGNKLKDFWAQEADVIAKAAVNAGLKALNGGYNERVIVLSQSDIIKLGRTEWEDISSPSA